jgi:hypothetical protein
MSDIDYKEPASINIHDVIPGSHGKMNGAGILVICMRSQFDSYVKDHFCGPKRLSGLW